MKFYIWIPDPVGNVGLLENNLPNQKITQLKKYITALPDTVKNNDCTSRGNPLIWVAYKRLTEKPSAV
jgi:hypothetical protein